ncbi:MAG: sulfate adenylyltransferase subunit CysD [Candidatus Accumulibacter sp.]|uniref:Sulfate adenylyltransferase subunit 2 n=1 Tax=Candidatus Accumulibacter proximus TaxID=2954385 RepID=A0A935PZ18_9PROT|nr:sulfate adenylyltransferase subunit CysD [Candidatus Accumulibacter proximus]
MMESDLFSLDDDQAWDTELAFQHLQSIGKAHTKRTAERKLRSLNIVPDRLLPSELRDEHDRPPNKLLIDWALEKARDKRKLPLFTQLHDLPSQRPCLHANDGRGARYWVPLKGATGTSTVLSALETLQQHVGKAIAVFPHGELVAHLRTACTQPNISVPLSAYPPILDMEDTTKIERPTPTPHLKRLEAESIYIIREAVAASEKPVMLYSMGKDSSVMLHLARKSFYPAAPPFPLLHVDTLWKFQEMYLFRDHMAQVSGTDLLVHVNPEVVAKGINPFDHGSALHTDIAKTEGLKQALDKYKFDVVFGGARRDEEKSRAKERIFSIRAKNHRWDPKNQRPELWDIYNTRKSPDENIRVFPLSNWTELDIWQYIYQEHIPVVPLYFSKRRPVVVRNGMILMVDDARFRLLPDEEITERQVRFRTLGCYPLTGAIESSAGTVPEIILELIKASRSERQGRLIDNDASGSMEKKKQEGYF